MKRFGSFNTVKSGTTKVFNNKSHIDKMYKGEWAEYSVKFLAVNTRCYCCGGKSEATDHITVHKGDFELFYSKENHMPLCHRCHNTITGKFDRRLPQKLEEKLKWVAMNRARNMLDFPVKVIPFVFESLKTYRLNKISGRG